MNRFSYLLSLMLTHICFHISVAQPGPIWQKVYGGPADEELIPKVISVKNGGLLLMGFVRGKGGNISEAFGGYDAWFVKIDGEGNIEWEKSFGGPYTDRSTDLIETDDGGFVGIGDAVIDEFSPLESFGGLDTWAIKLSSEGEIEWQKSYGSIYNDMALNIIKANDGGYIMTGVVSTGFDVYDEAWIIKIADDGSMLWQKMFGGSAWDAGKAIFNTDDGNYLVLGETSSHDRDVSNNKGFYDFWVIKLDQNGEMIWEKTFGGAYDDRPSLFEKTEDGDFVIAGNTWSSDGDITGFHPSGSPWPDNQPDIWIIKINQDGKLVWENAIGGSNYDKPSALYQTSNNDFLMIPVTNSLDGDLKGLPLQGSWIIRLDKNGSIIWNKKIESFDKCGGIDVLQTIDGGFYFTGYCGPDSLENSGYDGYIYKIDNSSELQWQQKLGGSMDDLLLKSTRLVDHSIISYGFTKSEDGDIEGFHGDSDFWLVKMESDDLASKLDEIELNIFPNPSSGIVWIVSTDIYEIREISFYTIHGQLLFTENNFKVPGRLDLSKFPNGVFIAKIESEVKKLFKKIILNR